MRSLVLTGAIAVFIGTALVPPSGTSVGAKIIESAGIDTGRIKSFISGNPVSSVQLLRAGAVVENAVRTPIMQNALQTVGGTQGAEIINAIDPFAIGKKKVTPQVAVEVFGSAAKTLTAALLPKEKSADPLAAAITHADPALKHVLEKISWARDKSDVHLCSDALDVIDASIELKSGDVLALCLALVNREPDRCVQIADSDLSKLCQTALAS